MAESVQVAVVVVFALLVGVSIPVLLSLRGLLKNAAHAVGTLERRVDDTLEKANTILGRLDVLTEPLEEGTEGVHNVVTTVNELSRTLLQIQRTLRVATAAAAAVGPAVMAFARAVGDGAGKEAPDSGEDDLAAAPSARPERPRGASPQDMAADI